MDKDNPFFLLEEYELKHLVAHFEEAGLNDDLHDLFTVEFKGCNAWYSAKEDIGDTEGFLSDVTIAWRVAKLESASSINQDKLALSINLELRYALVTSSIKSSAGNIPSNLLMTLVKTKIWTCSQGLAYALQVPIPEQRSEILADLSEVCESLRERALLEALTAAQDVKDLYWREGAIAKLALRLPQPLLRMILMAPTNEPLAMEKAYSRGGRQAVPKYQLNESPTEEQLREMLAAIMYMSETEKVKELRKLAPYLTDPLVAGALEAVQSIKEELQRTFALGRLVPRLVELGHLEEAISETQEIAFVRTRMEALSRLIRISPEVPHDTLLRENLAAAREIREPYWRATVLVNLTSQVSTDSQHDIVLEALTAARTIGDLDQRSETLVDMGTHLCEIGYPEDALAIVQVIEVEQWKARALARFASLLPNILLEDALTIGRSIADEYWKARAIIDLAPYLPETLKMEVLQESYDKVKAVKDYHLQVELLSMLAYHMPEKKKIEILRSALSITNVIKSEHRRAETLTSLSMHLPKSILHEALKTTHDILDEDDRSQVLMSIVSSLCKVDHPEKCLRIALQEITDEYWREEALFELYKGFVESNQLEEAFAVVEKLKYENWRAAAITCLASYSSEEQLDKLKLMVHTIKSARWQIVAFLGLYPYLTLSSKETLFRELLEIADGIKDENDLVRVYVDLAPHLSLTLLSEVLSLVRTKFDAENQSEVLAALLPQLAKLDKSEEALQLTKGITEDKWRTMALIRIVPCLSTFQKRDNLCEAVKIIQMIPNAIDQAELLVNIIPYLDDSLSAEVYACWSTILPMLASRDRQEVFKYFSNLLPVMTLLGGPTLVKNAVTTIREVSQWWP